MANTVALSIGAVTFALGVFISFFFQNFAPAIGGLIMAIILEIIVAIKT